MPEEIKLSGLSVEETNHIIPEHTILLGYVGSMSHGTHIKTDDPNGIDDIDILGVCIGPVGCYWGMDKFEQKESRFAFGKNKEYDSVVYEATKFLHLMSKQNPNVLCLLWLKQNNYIHIGPEGKLLIENRDIFTSKEVYHSFTGYAWGQLHKMTSGAHQGYMGEKRKQLVSKFGFDCYEEATTEFLTERGWKKFDEIVKNNYLLGTVEPKTGTIMFETFNTFGVTDKFYTGPMLKLNAYSTSASVTPTHRMLVSPAHRNRSNRFSTVYTEEKSNWNLVPFTDLLNQSRSHFHIRRVGVCNRRDVRVEDSYLQLAGVYVSEGTTNFYKGKCKSIRITQTKPGPFFDLMDDLSKLYPFRRYDYKKETVWILHGDTAKKIFLDFGHRKGKHLPTWCFYLSNRQANLFFKALLLGDGTEKQANSTYYTGVKTLADDIHAMLTSAGILATVYGPFSFQTTYGMCTMYQIVRTKVGKSIVCLNTGRILREGDNRVGKNGYPVIETLVKNTRVVCFEVPNGTLITRNQGKVAIQGNCKNAAHLVRLLRMGIEFLIDGQLRVHREDAPELISIKKGEWPLEKVKEEADRLFKLAQEAFIRSDLPPKPDMEAIKELCKDVVLGYFRRNKIPPFNF